MKIIKFLAIFLTSCIGGSSSDNITTTSVLSQMKSPVIVVTGFSNDFVTTTVVKDSTGKIVIIHDNALRLLHKGDTIK